MVRVDLPTGVMSAIYDTLGTKMALIASCTTDGAALNID